MNFPPVKNSAKGNCWADIVAQKYAIGEGWAMDLVERAFTNGDRERLFRLHTALRQLTIEVFNTTTNGTILDGFSGPQTAYNERDIRRLALNSNQRVKNANDFRNTVLYMDPVGGGGGHSDDRGIHALCEGFGVHSDMGPKDYVQAAYIDGSTDKFMAQHDDAHWTLVVLHVS